MPISLRTKILAAVMLIAAAILGTLALLKQPGRPAPAAPGDSMAPSQLGAPFILTDQDGQPFDSGRLKGKVALIFFGFTHCPDVCPTTLASMTNVLEALGPDAASVQPVFISIDPERDTPAALAKFRSLFDSRIVMLTGSPDQIASVAVAYRVYYKRQEATGGGDYFMDHTASVFLFDRQGRFRSTFDFHEDERVILEKVSLLLSR